MSKLNAGCAVKYADAERLCKSGHGCQAVSEYAPPEPMARASPPSGLWQDCAADILGPLPSKEKLYVMLEGVPLRVK